MDKTIFFPLQVVFSWVLAWLGIRRWCPLPSLSTETQVAWICVDPEHAIMVHVSSYMCQICCVWKHWFFGVFYSPLAITIFLPPAECPDPCGGGLMETSCLGLHISRCLILCTLSNCESLYVFPLLQKKVSQKMAKQGTDL